MSQASSSPVPRRVLGKTGLSIPVIPFGTQGFGNHFGFVADADAVALVKHAVALGVNHFDCARCYGDSLRKLGLALREIPRDEVIVTGRLCCHSGADWGGYGDGEPDYSAERVVRDVENPKAPARNASATISRIWSMSSGVAGSFLAPRSPIT